MRILRVAFLITLILTAVWTFGATKSKPVSVDGSHYQTATLAGGCFWGLQEELRKIPGVIKITVGYTGGTTVNPTYEQVAGGKTGHLEAVEVIFDPAQLSYDKLLADFLTGHNSVGNASRIHALNESTIFYHGAAQRVSAENLKAALNQSGSLIAPVRTQIREATAFYPAEPFHQDYYRKTAVARSCPLD